MQQRLTNDSTITYDYDSVQDMLYILFEPVTGATFYEDVPDKPGIMLRFNASDERVVGITIHDVSDHLDTHISAEEAIQQLAQSLVRQLR